MNTRVLIYGLVALVLFLMLSEDGPPNKFKPSVDVASRQRLSSLCLEEVVGFSTNMEGKLYFCECVTSQLAQHLDPREGAPESGLLKLKENFVKLFEATTKKHVFKSNEAYSKARALASYEPVMFQTESRKLDILLRRFAFETRFPELEKNYTTLAELMDKAWKASFHLCQKKILN